MRPMEETSTELEKPEFVQCVFCGDKNAAADKVCGGCGKPITPETSIPIATVDPSDASQIAWPVL